MFGIEKEESSIFSSFTGIHKKCYIKVYDLREKSVTQEKKLYTYMKYRYESVLNFHSFLVERYKLHFF